MDRKTALDLLKLIEPFQLKDVKKAYKVQALQWHPDKNKDEDTTEKFKKIGAAYDYLKSITGNDWQKTYSPNPDTPSGSKQQTYYEKPRTEENKTKQEVPKTKTSSRWSNQWEGSFANPVKRGVWNKGRC